MDFGESLLLVQIQSHLELVKDKREGKGTVKL